MTFHRPNVRHLETVYRLVLAECAKRAPKIVIVSDDSDRANASRWGLVDDISRHNPDASVLTCSCNNAFTALRRLQDQENATVIALSMQAGNALIEARKTDLDALVLPSPFSGSVQATVIKKGQVVHTTSTQEVKSANKPQRAFVDMPALPKQEAGSLEASLEADFEASFERFLARHKEEVA